jgi:hypothetical protein
MSRLMRIWYVGMLWLLSSVGAHALADPVCPEGFQHSPSGLVCFAKNLAGSDGAFSGLTAPTGADGACPPRFERPPGVNFCVLNTLTVNATAELLILEAQTGRLCPDGFQRPAGVNLCVASNLLLKKQGSNAVLNGAGGDCPVGFFRPVGSTICVAGIEQARTLSPPSGARCPPGFHRPPGVTVCIAKNLIYSTSLPANVAPPTGLCPKNWHRPPGLRFCIPKYIKTPTMSGLNPVLSDTIILPCPAGTFESWFDVPVYDEAGLFVVDYVTTRFCLPEGLEPAG